MAGNRAMNETNFLRNQRIFVINIFDMVKMSAET